MTVLILIAALATASTASVLAGGDDYDAANDTEAKGPVYFGFVRDNRGSPVPVPKAAIFRAGRQFSRGP